MQHIDVEIKNFGKIKQAKFQVKPFTVIAGKNASGKSFVTRGLYSVFRTLNKDHLSIELEEIVFDLLQVISDFKLFNEQFTKRSLNYLVKMDKIASNLNKNIQLTTTSGGHMFPLEQPEITAQLIDDIIGKQ